MKKKMSKKTVIVLISIIAILLIGICLKNMIWIAPPPRDDEKHEQMQIEAINSRFLSFEGERDKYQVRNLITKIKTHNKQYMEVDKIVTFNNISNENEIDNIRETILASDNTYNISFEYDENGLIKNIICEEVE